MLLYLPPTLQCLLFVLAASGLAMLGHAAFRRVTDADRHRGNREVAAILFGTISLIYSLVLAFAIVAVWEDYEEANTTINKEAEKLASVLGHSPVLPPDLQAATRQHLILYLERAMDAEWQQANSPVRTQLPIFQFRRQLVVVAAQGGELGTQAATMVQDLDEALALRAERLEHTRSHVPALVWVILIGGSVLVLYFSWFLSATDGRLHLLWTALLAAMMGGSLFLVYSLDRPFAPGGVSTAPLQRVLTMAKD